MKDYFLLQYKMLNRRLRDFGVHPILGYVLMVVGFVFFSELAYSKIGYASYLYLGQGFLSLTSLSGAPRNNLLKSCFDVSTYRKIRAIENLVIAIPFALFFVYRQDYLFALILSVVSYIMSWYQTSISFNRYIPTPFGRRPFEFARGIRLAWPLVVLSYFLCFMAIKVDNFNLGLFSLALIFVTSMIFYSESEGEYLVWIHRMKPDVFIKHKTTTAIIYSVLMALPIVTAMIFAFSALYRPVIIITIIGLLNMISIVLLRYTSYPRNPLLPHTALFVIAAIFSPLLLVALPYFYKRSVRSLYKTLG